MSPREDSRPEDTSDTSQQSSNAASDGSQANDHSNGNEDNNEVPVRVYTVFMMCDTRFPVLTCAMVVIVSSRVCCVDRHYRTRMYARHALGYLLCRSPPLV